MTLSREQLAVLYSEAFQQGDEPLLLHYRNVMRNFDKGLTGTISEIGWVAPAGIYEYNDGIMFVVRKQMSFFCRSDLVKSARIMAANEMIEVWLNSIGDKAKFKPDGCYGPFDRIPPDQIYVINKVRIGNWGISESPGFINWGQPGHNLRLSSGEKLAP